MNDQEQKDFAKYRAQMSRQMAELIEEVIVLKALIKSLQSSSDCTPEVGIKMEGLN